MVVMENHFGPQLSWKLCDMIWESIEVMIFLNFYVLVKLCVCMLHSS